MSNIGLFEKIFPKKATTEKAVDGFFKAFNAYNPTFTSYEGGIYEMELTRAAIHSFATHCSKLKPEIQGSAYRNLEKTLQFKPNPFMDTTKFLYRLATILSSTTDLTCATVIFKVRDNETLYVKQMYWLPADLLEQRTKEDKIPYNVWHEQGLLRVSDGNKINYKDVVAWFLEIQNEMDIYIYKIGYDSWNSQYIVDELQQAFGKESTEAVIQGKKTMSSPMKTFSADLKAKKINYDNHPILKWNLANAAIDVDKNDNIQLMKTSNSRRRIDGVASLLDAYIALERNYDNYMNLI